MLLAAHFALGFVAHPPAARRAPARSCSRASVALGPFGAADRWYREHSLRIRWQVARCRRQTSPPQPYPHLASPHRVPPPHLTACRLTPPRSSQLTAFRLASDPMAGGCQRQPSPPHPCPHLAPLQPVQPRLTAFRLTSPPSASPRLTRQPSPPPPRLTHVSRWS